MRPQRQAAVSEDNAVKCVDKRSVCYPASATRRRLDDGGDDNDGVVVKFEVEAVAEAVHQAQSSSATETLDTAAADVVREDIVKAIGEQLKEIQDAVQESSPKLKALKVASFDHDEATLTSVVLPPESSSLTTPPTPTTLPTVFTYVPPASWKTSYVACLSTFTIIMKGDYDLEEGADVDRDEDEDEDVEATPSGEPPATGKARQNYKEEAAEDLSHLGFEDIKTVAVQAVKDLRANESKKYSLKVIWEDIE